MRVYDLARTLGMKSKELLPVLQDLNISVTTASSSVPDKDVQRVMNHFKEEEQQEQQKKGRKGAKADSTTAELEKVRKEVGQAEENEKERLGSALEQARQRIAGMRAEKEKVRQEAETKKKDIAEQAAKERARREQLKRERAKQEAEAKEQTAEDRATALKAKLEQVHKKFEKEAEKKAPPRKKEEVESAAEVETKKPRKTKKKDRKQKQDDALVLPDLQVMRIDKEQHRGRRRPEDRGKKRRGKIKPTRILTENDVSAPSRQRPSGGPARKGAARKSGGRQPAAASSASKAQTPKMVEIRGDLTVGQFADKINVPVSDVMKTLFMMGETLTINEMINMDLMELVADEFDIEIKYIPDTDESDIEDLRIEDKAENLQLRPPIVTIMGHVDHGKTTLLDTIRKSDIVSQEFGGITQGIGAYYVSNPSGTVVFLDTPGHEAFTAMRSRGAQVTDIVILVVAANDGVKPQTIEAINHARSANVPIIVAVNKVDLHDADPMRTKQELMNHNLVSEEFGGDTIVVDVSAKQGTGLDKLFEMLMLQAEILELKADPDRPAEGVIIESEVDPTRGAAATVLVRKGTLNIGDYFVCGDVFGRVRRMIDEHGRNLKQAGPSRPVEIIGLQGAPEAGEFFIVTREEKTARDIAEKRSERRRKRDLSEPHLHVTLDSLHDYIEEGKIKEVPLIIKADYQGSVEAVQQSLLKLPSEKVKIKIIHSGVGAISESDVNLAMSADAIIVGFNVRPESSASILARNNGVDIRTYRVIYDLLEDIEKALVGMLEPTYREIFRGRAEILQVFRISKVGNVAGCFVEEGEMLKGQRGRLIRDNVVVYEGKIVSLRRVKDSVEKVESGLECGVQLENFQDMKEGDVIECFELQEVAQVL